MASKRRREEAEDEEPAAKKQQTSTTLFKQKYGKDAIVFKSNKMDEAYRFLSNFAVVVPPLEYAGLTYATVEHAFQATKAHRMGLRGLGEQIRAAETPAQAKQLGGRVGMRDYVLGLDWRAGGTAATELPDLAQLLRAATTKPARIAAANAWLAQRYRGVFENAAAGYGSSKLLMHVLLDAKFRNPEMRRQLLATGTRALGELRGRGDTDWAISPDGEPGVLGDLLMAVRADIVRGAAATATAPLPSM